MTRRAIPLVVAAVVAIAAAALGVGLGMLSAARHAHARPSAKTSPHATTPVVPLRFTSKSIKSGYVDSAPKGWSAGDFLTQHSVWSNAGTRAGDMALTATVTRRTGKETGEVLFTAVASLKFGHIVMTGTFDVVPQNQTFQAAITGGTGAFVGAHGHAVFEQVSGNRTHVSLYFGS